MVLISVFPVEVVSLCYSIYHPSSQLPWSLCLNERSLAHVKDGFHSHGKKGTWPYRSPLVIRYQIFIKEQIHDDFRYRDRVVSKRDKVLVLMECLFTFGKYIQDLTPTTFLTNQAIALVQSVSPK